MNSLQEKMKILVESMAAVADDHLGTIHILRKLWGLDSSILDQDWHGFSK